MPAWAGQPGEPFDVKKFLADRAPPPPDNAAPLYLSALAPISGHLGGDSAKPLEKEIADLANLDKLAAGNIQQEQIHRALAASAQAVQSIDAAQAKPHCTFAAGLTVDTDLAYVQGARSVARLTVLQLQQARATGDYTSAEAATARGLRMSRDLQPRGHVVCQLVSISMDSAIYSALERITLADPHLTPQHCDRLLAVLATHREKSLNRLDEGLRMEYITSRNCIHDIQSGRLSPQQIVDFLGPGAVVHHGGSQYPKFNFDAEVAALNRLYTILIADSQNATQPPPAVSRFDSEMTKLVADAKAAGPATRQTGTSQVPVLVVVLAATIDAFGDANRRSTAHLAGLQMLIAMRRYELAHGTLPSALDPAAAESSLKTVPIDPYSGGPLKYAMVAGKPIIYSIGKDLADDGGQTDWEDGRKPGDYRFILAPQAEPTRQ